MKTQSTLLALAAIAIFSASCETVGYRKADNTAAALQSTAQSIDKAVPTLDAALLAFDNLVESPAGELTTRFKVYSDSLANLKADMQAVSQYAESMQIRGDAFFQNWDSELSKIQNNRIESRSRERMEELKTRFNEANIQYAQSADDLSPFLSNLSDIRTALATDLTAGGIDSVKGMRRQLSQDGQAIRTRLVELSADCKAISEKLSENLLATT